MLCAARELRAGSNRRPTAAHIISPAPRREVIIPRGERTTPQPEPEPGLGRYEVINTRELSARITAPLTENEGIGVTWPQRPQWATALPRGEGKGVGLRARAHAAATPTSSHPRGVLEARQTGIGFPLSQGGTVGMPI
ncbi:unnamed protein product [Boreogadus saida]